MLIDLCYIYITCTMYIYIYICIQIFISFIYLHNIYIFIYLYHLYASIIYAYIYIHIYMIYIPEKFQKNLATPKFLFFFRREGSNPMQQLRHQNFMPGSLGAETTGEFFH